MEGEYCAIASFTEQCPALITDLFGGCDPAGGLEIKFTEALKPPVELFRHQRNAHFLCSPDRASLRQVFREFPERFFIVAQASSAYGDSFAQSQKMSLPFSSKPMVSGSPPLSSIRFSVSSADAFSLRRVSTSAQESPGCLFMFSENLFFNVSIIAVSFL